MWCCIWSLQGDSGLIWWQRCAIGFFNAIYPSSRCRVIAQVLRQGAVNESAGFPKRKTAGS